MKYFDFLNVFKSQSHKNVKPSIKPLMISVIYKHSIFEEPKSIIECECDKIENLVFDDNFKKELDKNNINLNIYTNVDEIINKKPKNIIPLNYGLVTEMITESMDNIGMCDTVQLSNKRCEAGLRLTCKNSKYKNDQDRLIPTIIIQ